MTHTKDDSLKLMIDALKASKHGNLDHKWADEAIVAGEQALAAPVHDSTCSETLRAQGKAYSRTGAKCGKGPCIATKGQP
jgi:hypothetical protein